MIKQCLRNGFAPGKPEPRIGTNKHGMVNLIAGCSIIKLSVSSQQITSNDVGGEIVR